MPIPLFVLTGLASIGKGLIGYASKRADAQVEHHRIDANLSIENLKANAAVIRSAQGYKWFWIPWLIASVPAAIWFAWGMMDSTFTGRLPDVTELPPQLKEAYDIVWSNIFYSGAAVGSVQIAARTAAGIFARR